MRIKIETITPAKAAELLEANTCNRTIRMAKVAEYANEMAAGRWAESGQGIIMLDDGSLGDGQHRLLAVIKSGVTITIPVVYDVSLDAMGAIDVGAKRSIADYMHLHHGVKNSNLACAAGKAIYSICFGYQSYTIGAGLMEVVIEQSVAETLETLSIRPNPNKRKNRSMSTSEAIFGVAILTLVLGSLRLFYRAGYENGRDTGHIAAARRHARIMAMRETAQGEGRGE
jgi:hypothetical protein